MEYKGGAQGLYWASQIAVGKDNGFASGSTARRRRSSGSQENPNYCQVAYVGRPAVRLSRGRDALYPAAQRMSRIPAGHPEGYYEAFANIYAAFIAAVRKRKAGRRLTPEDLGFPGVDDGVRGVRFIERCVASSRKGAAWVKW